MAQGAKRYALLVGTSQFRDARIARLYAPDEDVVSFRDVLKDPRIAGFNDVDLVFNSQLEAVQDAVHRLVEQATRDDIVLFYYSGHGLQDTRGRLYFALSNSNRDRPAVGSLEASYVRRLMDECPSQRQIVILDCCHSGAYVLPGTKRGSDSTILKETEFDPKGYGRFILAASGAEESAYERDGKSFYTATLVEALRSGDAAPDKAFLTPADLHNYLVRQIAGSGVPAQPRFWIDEQTEPLAFAKNPNVRLPIDPMVVAALASAEVMMRYGAVRSLEEILHAGHEAQQRQARQLLRERADDRVEAYMVVEAAKKALQEVVRAEAESEGRPEQFHPTTGVEGPSPAADGRGEKPQLAPDGTIFRDLDEPWCPEMVVIPACPGGFLMGSPKSEPERYEEREKEHKVTIAKRFAMGRFAVTFDEYEAFCRDTARELGKGEADDRGWGKRRRPVINVSWRDADAYCRWLSERTGAEYRLPSEAEWEYACRGDAGGRNTTPFNPAVADTAKPAGTWITAAEANFDGNYSYSGSSKGEYRERTVEVDFEGFRANGFGLWQMHGNVWEWCADHFEENYDKVPHDGSPHLTVDDTSYRVLRGGSWYFNPRILRSAFRGWVDPEDRDGNIGFRLSRTLTP